MALIPSDYLDSVVAIGIGNNNSSIQVTSTGFIFGNPIKGGEDTYHLYLVTNEHVFEGKDSLQVRMNRPMGSDPVIYNLALKESDGSTRWTAHPDPGCDVAVTLLSANLLHQDGIDFKFLPGDEELVLTKDHAKEIEVSEGDGIFVLGFPLGQAGDGRSYTLVRQGCIARIRDWLDGQTRTFLIDASIYPGNSGGPVFIKPEAVALGDSKGKDAAYLIGMVSGYIPYQEIAVSQQTGQPR